MLFNGQSMRVFLTRSQGYLFHIQSCNNDPDITSAITPFPSVQLENHIKLENGFEGIDGVFLMSDCVLIMSGVAVEWKIACPVCINSGVEGRPNRG